VKRNLVWIVLVFLILGCSLAFSQEQKQEQYLILFSLSGGTMYNGFTLSGDFLYNRKLEKWGIQAAETVNINKNIHQSGFSAGAWRWFGSAVEVALFLDGLFLEGYAGFHAQIRPEFRIVLGKDLMVMGFFYAHPFTRDSFLEKMNPAAKAVRYFGFDSEIIFSESFKLKGDGIYSHSPFGKEDFFRLRFGGEFRACSWLTLSGEWLEFGAVDVLVSDIGGNYQVLKFSATINLGRARKHRFSNFVEYDVFRPYYPAVITNCSLR